MPKKCKAKDLIQYLIAHNLLDYQLNIGVLDCYGEEYDWKPMTLDDVDVDTDNEIVTFEY